MTNKKYTVKSAIDAQEMGYGDESYWDMLEESAKRHYQYFAKRGDMETAKKMLTQSLSEALDGNDGD